MEKKRIKPIVAERDDMIGRNIGGSRGDSTASKTRSNSSANTTGSGGNNVVVIFVLVGLVTAVGFGWLQMVWVRFALWLMIMQIFWKVVCLTPTVR